MDNQKKLLHANFNIFPVEGGGDKAPMILRESDGSPKMNELTGVPYRFGWAKVRKQKMEPQELEKYDTFGVCCGCNGLEVIDIDNKFGDAPELFDFVKDNFDLRSYLVIGTQSGGFHIYYRCERIEGNLKLASRPGENGKPVTLIETRGDGGYVVFYDNIFFGNIDKVPCIDSQTRDDLLSICRSLNEVESGSKSQKNDLENDGAGTGAGTKPGDIYNNDLGSVEETKRILNQAGWQEFGNHYWKRPNKNTPGISATFGKIGVNRFYVFSTDAFPFKSMESYSMFGVRAELLHGGDYSKCASELAEKYSVKQSKRKKYEEPIEVKNKDKWDVLQEIIKDWDIRFRFNELMKNMQYFRSGIWHNDIDIMIGDLIMEMETNRFTLVKGEKKKINISKNKISEMILNRSICEIYNPVRNFFKQLPKWDGVDRFMEMENYLILQPDESGEFFISMLKKHIIRAVKCAISDYVNRFVFVFYGPQEIGKSKFWQWIVDGELYNDEQIDPTNKDSVLSLGRYLILNIDELDSLNKKEVAKLKAFISKGDITKRVSFGRFDEKFNRIASIVASTNESDILADISNTRWLILKVKHFKWQEYTKKIDPKMLWAQAYEELKKDPDAGELTKEEKEERELRNNKEFLETTLERELLMKHFYDGEQYMTASDVKVLLETKYYGQKINFHQLTRELKRIFGMPLRTSKDGRGGRWYKLGHNITLNEPSIPYHEMGVIPKEDLPF